MTEPRTDEDRVARYREQLIDGIQRGVALALDGLTPEDWRTLHRATLHGATAAVRATMDHDGLSVQVLRLWQGDEPDLIHQFTITPPASVS